MSAGEPKKTRTIPQNDDRRRQLRASRAEKDRAETRVLGDILNRYVVLGKLLQAAEPTQVLAQVSVAAARRRPPTPPPVPDEEDAAEAAVIDD
jgi:hypothetical protein